MANNVCIIYIYIFCASFPIHISSDPLIHIKKLGLVKYELDINVYHLKTDYFLMQFFYKTELRVSSQGKHVKIIRLKNT